MKVVVDNVVEPIFRLVPVILTEDILNELQTQYGTVFLPEPHKWYYHISTREAAPSINKSGLLLSKKGTRKKANASIGTDHNAIYLTNNPYKLIHPDNGSGSFWNSRDELVLYGINKSWVDEIGKLTDQQYPTGPHEATFAFYLPEFVDRIPPEEMVYFGKLTVIIGEEGYKVTYYLDINDDIPEEDLDKLRKEMPELFRDKYKIAIYTEYDFQNPLRLPL